ncbi:MAG: hypothetical protein ACXVP0_08400 [Bacteroidia bacterium]
MIFGISAFAPKEKDPLNKRVFLTKITEVKEGQPNIKPHDDEMEFKGGKVFSNVLDEKLQYKWMKYTLKSDSTFIDDKESERSYFELEVNFVDDREQTVVMTCKINNEDISGEIKISKKDKLKKKYTFAGKEKLKKDSE